MHKIFKLSNGIRVVTETTDYVKSVSSGVWVGAGSANENARNNGISHFIEHMLFKGTTTRSAKEIAECMDSVGGQLNAVTTKEYTCFYTKTLSEHLGLALELVSDMVRNSTFTQENIELERKVILEEISMGEDDPEDLIYDITESVMWSENPLGLSVAGTAESVGNIDREMMLEYFNEKYVAENMVISLVGNFDEEETLKTLEALFGNIRSGENPPTKQVRLEPKQNVRVVKKDIEQCQLCIGLRGYPRTDEREDDLAVVSALFGGNMSSRLFQKVREECGLAYSVYSESVTYTNNGSFRIYAGFNPENLIHTLQIINDEIKRLKSEKFTTEEIETAKIQMKASVVMDSEGVSDRECVYGKMFLLDGEVKTLDEEIERIDNISLQGVSDAIDFIFDRDFMTIAVLGRVDVEGRNLIEVMDF